MKRLLIAGMTIAMMACDPQKDLSYRFDEMTYSPKETVFKVFAPENARCFVVVSGWSTNLRSTTH